MIKKSTSLYEARSKHKAERSKNEYLNRLEDPCDSNKDEGVEVGRVPRLNPTKSSPVNDYIIRNDEDIAFTIPSYRHSNDLKARGDNYDVPDNWEVSRIEQNSDVERSFKNEVRVLLPDEERKLQNYEIERRLEGLANEEDDEYFIKNKDGFVKKVPASPASEENFGSSMITYNKDSSKNDLSRMMITVDQYIYVISGYKNTTLTSVERLNMNKGIWQNVSEVNIGRTKFGAVSYKGEKIYIMGGKLLDGSRTDLIEEFDIRADKWSMSKLKLPSPRSGFCWVLINDKQLLIVGGNDGQVLDSMHLLNLSTGDWSELPPMTTKRDELAVAVGPDGKIYVIGGYGGLNSAWLKSVERFNLQTYEWEKVADLNQPRRALSAVSLPDGVYVIGGYNGSRYLGWMERYDESQNKWIKCAEMNSPRCTLSAVSSNDCQYIYAMGGFDGTYMDVVERYDHVHDWWDYVTPMMTTRFMHSSCIVNVIRK